MYKIDFVTFTTDGHWSIGVFLFGLGKSINETVLQCQQLFGWEKHEICEEYSIDQARVSELRITH